MSRLEDCRWPELAEPYDTALRQVVAFALERFDVRAVVAAGTIVRGVGDPASDLDTYVIHTAAWRQRLQRFFNGVPAELFVNSLASAERYLEQEIKEARPHTAHMLATGFAVLDLDGWVADVRVRAQALLDAGPPQDPQRDLTLRYAAATLFEDATDVVGRDPALAHLLLSEALAAMLDYGVLAAGRFRPRRKDLLSATEQIDPELADQARRCLGATDLDERVELGQKIADRTIGTRGFFEWESPEVPFDS